MKSKGKSTLFALCLCCVLFLCGGCVSGEKTLTEFTGYTKLVEKPDSISVSFHDEYVGEYTITEEEYIKDICTILMSRVYVKLDDVLSPGSNVTLQFYYYDGESVSLSTRSVSEDGVTYVPKENDDLNSYLVAIGNEKGAIESR